MVLGYSLKRTGTKHARVCLYTDDVPQGHVEILSELWDCRPIEHVDAAVRALNFSEKEDRFEKVFTKLRGMELTEFAKVLMMDIDLLVRSNIDELFDLPAPAAMRRGMNDRYPYRTGDTIDGRAFFLGTDRTKWSWGQGTGINAGVMLWQPDSEVFQQMMSEIQEPNHPEHCKGNGPEQDFLSRFWADAPWTHIGVEYNFQLHQMFFAIHPDRADRAERVMLLQAPEKVKIVHYSGEPTAKPWHRVLDSKWENFWPDRSRDAEYMTLFADEFLGHWLWVRKDRATFDNASTNPRNWDMEGMFLDERGDIYRKSWYEGEPPQRLEVPESASKGATDFLGIVLREWFDTLQELEAQLGFEIRERIEPAVVLPTTEAGSTGGTDAVSEAVPGQALQLQRATACADGSRPSPPPVRQQFAWRRHGGRSGWWVEERERGEDAPSDDSWARWNGKSGDAVEATKAGKATAVCGVTAGSHFVGFVEGGVSTLDEQGAELSGLFVKVIGHHAPRHMQLPADAEEVGGCLDESLTPVHLWVDGVPPGAGILLAMVDLAPAILEAVLSALAPLGVPQVPPPAGCRALAAAGRRPAAGDEVRNRPAVADEGRNRRFGRSPSSKAGQEGDTPYATHASQDIAYAAAMLLPAS